MPNEAIRFATWTATNFSSGQNNFVLKMGVAFNVVNRFASATYNIETESLWICQRHWTERVLKEMAISEYFCSCRVCRINYANLTNYPELRACGTAVAKRASDCRANVWKWWGEITAMNSYPFLLFLSFLLFQGSQNIGGKYCTIWCSGCFILE